MDNEQMPSVQTMPPVQGTTNGMPMVQQVQVESGQKKDVAGLIKTIAIILISLVAVTFIGLFIWMFMRYSEVQRDVDGQISQAVAEAKDEQYNRDQLDFQALEKNPYKTFAGPVDYGQLTFLYPKTWSVYIAADASNGGDFSAYFNPGQVEMVSRDTINALRLTIRDKSFDDVAAEYQKEINKKDSGLTVESITIGDVEKGTSTTANRYTGNIPGTDLNGYIVIFKIRDKTAVLQTDSVLFKDDFDNLLGTVVFNA